MRLFLVLEGDAQLLVLLGDSEGLGASGLCFLRDVEHGTASLGLCLQLLEDRRPHGGLLGLLGRGGRLLIG